MLICRRNDQAIDLVKQYLRHRNGLRSEKPFVQEIAVLACNVDIALMWLLTQE